MLLPGKILVKSSTNAPSKPPRYDVLFMFPIYLAHPEQESASAFADWQILGKLVLQHGGY